MTCSRPAAGNSPRSAGPLNSGPRASGLAAWAPWILILAGSLIYANSFSTPLVFDAQKYITGNPSLDLLWPWRYTMARNRPVGFFTFALNHLCQPTGVWGYHAVNLAIHLAAGLLLYGLVRRTLSRPPLAARYGPAAVGLALAAALIWLVHPLQTQSVTYVYQRLESLMGLFYLATLYGFVRAQNSPKPWLWYALSVACCALGMGTKEVMVTAPLAVLFYDRTLASPSWASLFARRWPYYLALSFTWAILASLMKGDWANYEANGVVTVPGATPLGYALTQPGVILHYLRLAFWPSGQCIDYAWPLAAGFWRIVPQAAAVLALLALTAWCVWRRPAWGFVLGCFFLILAPTSSVVPVVDPAFEHRMYLPLAPVAIVVALAGYELTRRWLPPPWQTVCRVALLCAAAAALGMATFERNRVYADEIMLWSDVIQASPANARAFANRGVLRAGGKDYAGALADYNRSLALNPTLAETFNNRAMLLASAPDEHFRNGKQAVADARQACKMTGWQRADILDTLAAAYAETGDFEQAVIWQQKAIQQAADNPPFVKEAQERLQLYRNRQPFRERRTGDRDSVVPCPSGSKMLP